MFRAQAQALSKAPLPWHHPAGTIEGDYVDSSDVSHGFVRASDGTITTFDVRARAQALAKVPYPRTSARPGWSREITWTPSECSITASCVLSTAPSPRSMFRARATGPGQGTTLFATIRWMRSPDPLLTRADGNHGSCEAPSTLPHNNA